MEGCEACKVEEAGNTQGQEFFLVVETQGELYALRWILVKEVTVLSETEVDLSIAEPVIRRNGTTVPVHHLWRLVGLSPPKERQVEIPAVLLEEEKKAMVVVPERILWRQEARLQELPTWIRRTPVVGGAIVLESGVVVIALEPLRVLAVPGEAA
ncbi:MAG: chemotaxis protein CheW [Candidatus Eisenbacteria bacterium]